jgi:hypothetical protein
MKILTVVFCLMLSACATTEGYYRLPQTYHERLEAQDNPQNNGYVLRHRTNDPLGDFLGVLFVAATIADIFTHNHGYDCDH